MMKSDLKSLYFFHTVRVLGFALLALGITCVSTTFVRFFEPESIVERSLYIILWFISDILLLFFSFRKSGYDYNRKNEKLIDKDQIIAILLAWLTDVVLTVVFRYRTLGSATSVAMLAGIMTGDLSLGLKELANGYGSEMFLSLMIHTLPYIPAMMLGHVSGSKKRRRVRAEITSEQK